MNIKKGLFLFILFLVFMNPTPAFAKDYLDPGELNSLGFTKYESINSNSLLYPLKKIREKIFQVSEERLFETRFNELVYIANKRKTGFLESAAESYITIAGRMIEKKDPNLKDNAVIKLKILEKLRDGYPANSLPWIQIQQAVDTTKRLI